MTPIESIMDDVTEAMRLLTTRKNHSIDTLKMIAAMLSQANNKAQRLLGVAEQEN